MVFKNVLIFNIVLILLISTLISANLDNDINSWGYQLQDYNLLDLKDNDFDLLVIDYSKDGSADQEFTLNEISSIKEEGKTVLSYISIGEAEDYRYYFKENWLDDPPSWMDNENPKWKGNFKVRFWENEWKIIIFDYLDKIMSAGYDGIYLDIIDAYEFYIDEYKDADLRMIDFVTEISNYTKTLQGDAFLIYPQNGEELLESKRYRMTIDGIGKEDLYINPNRQKENKMDEIVSSEKLLDLLISDGKKVLVVDYTDDVDLSNFAKERSTEKGYIHYTGVLDLDLLVDQGKITKTSDLNFVFITQIIIALPILYKFRVSKKPNSK